MVIHTITAITYFVASVVAINMPLTSVQKPRTFQRNVCFGLVTIQRIIEVALLSGTFKIIQILLKQKKNHLNNNIRYQENNVPFQTYLTLKWLKTKIQIRQKINPT
jgi:hypothetical protein